MDIERTPIEKRLPKKHQYWLEGGKKSIAVDDESSEIQILERVLVESPLKWPRRKIIFITDPHADPRAFIDSLVASGSVRQTSDDLTGFKLTGSGRNALFVIGGDCFDKGPSNLGLLRSIKHLIDQGARVRLLAGNHDIRLLLGMKVVGHTSDPRSGHFFVRLGH
mgnify:FL=1